MLTDLHCSPNCLTSNAPASPITPAHPLHRAFRKSGARAETGRNATDGPVRLGGWPGPTSVGRWLQAVRHSGA